ncbi:hypothetical protein [Mangrovibacillus cuniculi]|uniref:Uncharacterized protein n=1 Tax=Mangrovibacillus cuniculi TaxID=2593652 RepID=A0A7S8C947_9BACI|nr:hypothetical protein [Mangrovibacillus cuniculi]QPC45618.1 hypothetical protein G8O30_00810 [Mangrovibacillus cuniculi]
MKRMKWFPLIFTLFILSSCIGPYTSTTSAIFIIDKGHSADYEEYWIKAYDPNNQEEYEAMKIIVKERMAWNLIEVNKEYFSTYSKKGENPWILVNIQHFELD